jgi:hypothetical protein
MTNFRMAALAIAVAGAMTGSEALAADSTLAPGKPAGVHEAQHHGPNLWLIVGVSAAVVAGIVIATTQNSAACSAAACPVTGATTSTS